MFLSFIFLFLPEVFADSIESATKVYNQMDMTERAEFLHNYPRISERYRLGASLIYDCRNRHFACVNQDSYENCEDEREKSIKGHKQLLNCAPLKHFKSLESCLLELYRAIHSGVDKGFCRRMGGRVF